MVTCDNPNFESERNSIIPGSPDISVSIGYVTSFSISSGARAGTSVLSCTWMFVMSGTASIGSRNADQTPTPMRMTVPRKTAARWRMESSRSRLSMA